MQNVGPLNGANLMQDYQATAPSRVSLVPGVIGSSSLAVTTNSVSAGEAFVLAERTNGEKVLVHFRNTEAVTVDTSGTTKVFVKIDQAKIDDGSANSVDGTGIASIQTGASYPASNYVPLASVTGGVITDERVEVRYQGKDFDGLVGFDRGADIASASTVDLGAATGNLVHVTGTTGITSFGSSAQPGTSVTVVFDGALLLTHSASLVIPGSANVTTSAGDSAFFVCESVGNWRCVSYAKANGTSITATTDINGLAATTAFSDSDEYIKYDATASANRKVPATTAKREIGSYFFGDGSDGDLTVSSGTTTLTPTSDEVFKQYKNLTISGGTLACAGKINHIYVSGTFTMSSGSIHANGYWGAGGVGGSTTAQTWTTGTNGNGIDWATVSGRDFYAWTHSGGAGNNASSAPGTGGAGGNFKANERGRMIRISVGAGGGGAGAADTAGAGWNGGAGGGVIIIIANRVNITGGTISANGVAGGDGSAFGHGGGGGGGGGSIVMLYGTLVSNTATWQCNGGNGWNGRSPGVNYSATGGGGGGGWFWIAGGNGGAVNTSAGNGWNGATPASNSYGTGGTGGTGAVYSVNTYASGGGGGGAPGVYYKAKARIN